MVDVETLATKDMCVRGMSTVESRVDGDGPKRNRSRLLICRDEGARCESEEGSKVRLCRPHEVRCDVGTGIV